MDAGLKEGIDYGLHDLPERLHEADHPGVCATLGDQVQDVTPQFPQDLPGAPHVLEYFHKLHPPSSFLGGGSFDTSPG